LAAAAADPESAALAVDIDGASIVFMTSDTMSDQLAAIRVLYRLLREANRA
jgi:ribose 5-phosphate isomerase RpiB